MPDRINRRTRSRLFVRGSNAYRRLRPRRHVLVSSRHEFVYFQVPKVATRSLLATLTSFDPEATEFNKIRSRPGMFAGYQTFAFVRDPWDRLCSCWANKVRDTDQFAQYYPELRNADFESFVRVVAQWDLRVCDAHVRLQSVLIPSKVGFVGRFERLDDDYLRLSSWLGLPLGDLPRMNVAKQRGGGDPYSEELRELVGTLYRRDLDRFGY
jgi:hypothetical protein